MASPEVRFHPPPLAPSADLRFILRRAFGPAGRTAPPDDPDAAGELAYRLDLAHRIAARHGVSGLRAEIGLRPAGRLLARHETIRRRAACLAEAAEPIAAAAAARGIPLVALKFLALRLDGLAPDGIRRAGDVDLLAREEDLGEVAALLAERNYRDLGYPAQRHAAHLEDPSGLAFDIHRHLPGVHLTPGSKPARLEDLEAAGLLVPAPHSSLRLPCRGVLIAHLVVHGLAHHGWTARGYPFLRMVADLADLGVRPEADAVESVHRLVGDEVTKGEIQALLRLVARLRDGDESLLGLERPGEADAVLLRHFVACVTDDDYASSLRLKAAFRRRHGVRPFWATIAGALFVTHAQIDLVYGKPRHRYGYVAWRLYRPIDLVVRALRYALATARLAARSSESDRKA